MVRKGTAAAVAMALGLAGALGLALGAPAGPASAAAGDPFPTGAGLVFVAQGPARGDPTTLYEAVQSSGAVTFSNIQTSPRATVGYNAIGFDDVDHYLYGVNDNNRLVRIGQGGAVTNLGVVVGLPTNTSTNFNQGAFGPPGSQVLYVRLATSDRQLYAVDVTTMRATTVALSAAVPNVSDFSYAAGYLWGVYGEGGQIYRIDVATGQVLAVAVTGLPRDPFGAQWTYGNGNLGISDNTTGTVYQLAIDGPSSSAPSVRIVSSTKGPANTQNDGAAYAGSSTDLSITKSAPATFVSGGRITYTLRVTNLGPSPSSGWVVDDFLPNALSAATTDAGCAITANRLTCAGAPLAVGATATITITATVTATTCVANTATVTGNESDPVLTDNSANATTCPAGQTPPSFTVEKTADPAPPSSVHPGDTVTYTVVVRNTGATAYTPTSPASFSDLLTNVTDDATVDIGSVAATGGTAAVDGDSLVWSGPLAVGGAETISYAVVVSDPDPGDHLLVNAVLPGATGTCAAGATCSVTTPVAGFTVSKQVSTDAANPGDTVTYAVTVTNTGRVAYTAASPAAFTDDLSAVLDDASFGSATNDAVLDGTTLRWSGALAVDASTTVEYTVVVGSGPGGNRLLVNTVAPAQPDGDCVVSCTTATPVASYTVAKSASVSSASPGDTIVYTLTVTNTGSTAYTAERPASLSDDLSGVLDDATYGDDATQGATVVDGVLVWSGPLAVSANVVITYSVTVHVPDAGDLALRNTVVPTSGSGSCAGTCTVDVPVTVTPAITVAKSSSVGTTTVPGARVQYSVTVTNTGDTDFTAGSPATFADDLSGVLDDATWEGDASPGAVLDGTTLRWSGALAVGEHVVVTYSVTVRTPDPGNLVLTNTVTPGAPGTCVTGECATTTTVVPSPGYTVHKTASTGSAGPGDTVTYLVTVTNTGDTDFTDAAPVTFSDDLAGVLDDATLGTLPRGATLAGTTLTWSGSLAVAATETIEYSVTVRLPDPGDLLLRNGVTPVTPSGACDAACTVDVPVTVSPAYTISKSASPATASPGDVVTYRVTVRDTGDTDFTADDPAGFSDDLSGVLDDATYRDDASGGAELHGTTLTWSGALAQGGVLVVTYSALVDTPDRGDGVLRNSVVPSGGAGSCDPDAACTADVPVTPHPSFTVAKSAAESSTGPGGVVHYTVIVTNTGDTDVAATLRDDLSGVLDDASFGDDATQGAALDGNVLAWSGLVPFGGRVVITYSVTVDAVDTGDRLLHNVVAPVGDDGSCTGTCTVDVPVDVPEIPTYTVAKTESEAQVQPGDRLTYTITVVNTGAVAFTADSPATFVDDLAGVLTDATWNDDVTAGAVLHGTTLSWTGPLAVGQTVSITYSVTVGAAGTATLVNTVAPGEPAGSCVTAAECQTAATVVPPPPPPPTPTPSTSVTPSSDGLSAVAAGGLSATGADTWPVAGLGVLALVVGNGLAVVARTAKRARAGRSGP